MFDHPDCAGPAQGAEKQGRAPSRHGHLPAHDFSKALQRCRSGLDFPLVWFFFSGLFFVGGFFLLFPFIVFCGRAGFLLSVSEVCSSDEKD